MSWPVSEDDELCRSMRSHTGCPGFGKTHRLEVLCGVCFKRLLEGISSEDARLEAYNKWTAEKPARPRQAVALFAFFGGTTVNFDPNHFQAGKAERIEPSRAFDLSKLPVIVTRKGARYEPKAPPPAARPATSGRRIAGHP